MKFSVLFELHCEIINTVIELSILLMQLCFPIRFSIPMIENDYLKLFIRNRLIFKNLTLTFLDFINFRNVLYENSLKIKYKTFKKNLYLLQKIPIELLAIPNSQFS